MSRSTALKRAASVLVVVAVGFFFARALQRNWSAVAGHDFQLSALPLTLSLLLTCLACFLNTHAWRKAINVLSPVQISFRESVAAVNITSLTKYVPGKIWSFALQMYWLVGDGFSRSLVLYVNVVNSLVSVVAGVLIALVALLFGARFPAALLLSSIGLVLLLDLGALAFQRTLFQKLGARLARRFNRELRSFDLPLSSVLELHAIHVAASAAIGLSMWLLAAGIGYQVELRDVLLITSAALLADIAGVAAFLVPAGIGVRESVMFLVLGGKASGSLALVLPLASRLLYVAADLAVGLVALKLLREFSRRRARREPGNALD